MGIAPSPSVKRELWGTFFGPYLFLSDGFHDIRQKSAQTIYANLSVSSLWSGAGSKCIVGRVAGVHQAADRRPHSLYSQLSQQRAA